jgi:hypothetical protein
MLPETPAVHVSNVVLACASGNGIFSPKKFVLNITLYDGLTENQKSKQQQGKVLCSTKQHIVW